MNQAVALFEENGKRLVTAKFFLGQFLQRLQFDPTDFGEQLTQEFEVLGFENLFLNGERLGEKSIEPILL